MVFSLILLLLLNIDRDEDEYARLGQQCRLPLSARTVPSGLLTMDTDDLFRSLAAGARFARADLRREAKLARQPKDTGSETSRRPEGANDGNGHGSLPAELDFFRQPKVNESSPSLSQAAKGSGDSNREQLGKPLKIPKKPIFPSEAAQRAFLKRKNIRIYGAEVAPPVRRFVDLCRPGMGMSLSVAHALREVGLRRMTPVQMAGTPILISGRDAFIVAPTGSGKTLVFTLALLTHLMGKEAGKDDSDSDSEGIQAVIISPTRELAAQILDEFRRFTPRTPKGRLGIKSVLLNKSVLNNWQMSPPKRPPTVLVSTPLRLVQAIETGAVKLDRVRHIILDEGDRLLELGLLEQLDDILAACTYAGGPIQKVLLSATIPTGVEDLARSFMSDDPIKIVVGTPNAAASSIKQRLLYVGQEEGKLLAIRQLLVEGKLEPPVIIFTETTERATGLFHALIEQGINVDMIHGGRTQAEREAIVANFRAERLWFLITTDLLARGLDFPSVSCVINYDMPLTTASYIHRIGRTGRAGKRGRAITFFTREDAPALRTVANVMRQSGCAVPEWMLQLKRASNKRILHEHRKRQRSEATKELR